MKKYLVKQPFAVNDKLYIEGDFIYGQEKDIQKGYISLYDMKTRRKAGYMKIEKFLEFAELTKS